MLDLYEVEQQAERLIEKGSGIMPGTPGKSNKQAVKLTAQPLSRGEGRPSSCPDGGKRTAAGGGSPVYGGGGGLPGNTGQAVPS